MDLQSTPFPGKARPWNSKTNRKSVEENKTSIRSTNVLVKTVVVEKPPMKSSVGIYPQPPKPSQHIPLKPNNKQEDDTDASCTPMPWASLSKPRISVTSYHSAQNCSNCRLDRLQTSSYWISQIKLAEHVGKHFVSATFFRLAFESNAELKRYLARHESLYTETGWGDVLFIYGLVKDVSNTGGDSALKKADTSELQTQTKYPELKEGPEFLDNEEAVEEIEK
ncbi:hypothetical protein HHK36_011124 [Tetracentron sinense]|uniref:Uncharacterized protein n=1 Tax=Tetracentron sinense TaxID=13715 RepID=A0A834Z7H4_TETSI|nr:hypothetical protein HHK36_011124 [Tetracentron sinense]